jgi:hypothetical protein
VAPYAVKPVRHSSWAIAGMPCGEASMTRDCIVRIVSVPCATVTGALPKMRVR